MSFMVIFNKLIHVRFPSILISTMININKHRPKKVLWGTQFLRMQIGLETKIFENGCFIDTYQTLKLCHPFTCLLKYKRHEGRDFHLKDLCPVFYYWNGKCVGVIYILVLRVIAKVWWEKFKNLQPLA